jgi:beta-glucanase (GH16 family)
MDGEIRKRSIIRARLENARVENGQLVIEARREAEPYQGHTFTSARLVTRGKASWTYARVEVRAQLPSGRGTWPAIWMLPDRQTYGSAYWPDNGEIDIMEHVGFDPDVVHGTVHTKAYNHMLGTQRGGNIRVSTARTEFHVYAIEWTPEEIRWFVDDSLYYRFPNERLSNRNADWRQWPFDQPFHLILNIAVGGTWGGMQGIDSTAFPARMLVDYVRVYQCKE